MSDKEKDQQTSREDQRRADWEKLHAQYKERKAQQEAEEREKAKDRLREMQVAAGVQLEEELEVEERPLSKKELRQARKAEKLAKRDLVWRRHLSRAIPVLIFASLGVLLFAYFVSPLSKMKNFSVSGNRVTADDTILKDAQVDNRDYTLTTFLNRAGHAKNIKSSNPWIKSAVIVYRFPINFQIEVEEYNVVAYNNQGSSFHPVLANGVVIDETVAEDALPKDYLVLNFNNRQMVKQFISEYEKLSSKTRSQIETVHHTPSAATKDLVTLTMKNGTKVLVPLSQLSQKMAYYQSIVTKNDQVLQIDMEAGVYSIPLDVLSAQVSQKAEKEGQSEGDQASQAAADANQATAQGANQAATQVPNQVASGQAEQAPATAGNQANTP